MATWVFQVMPIFFLVGGFANAASWASSSRDPARRRSWQYRRLRRLLIPTVPLIAFWCLAALIARLCGVTSKLTRGASQAALLPVWFLAVYIMVTVAVPATRGNRRIADGRNWATVYNPIADMARRGDERPIVTPFAPKRRPSHHRP